MRDIINATGGMTIYGAGELSDEARAAVDAISRRAVVMDELRDAASVAIAAALGTEAAFITNCVAAGLVLTAAAAMIVSGDADPAALPDAPQRRKIVLQKGHACNFNAEITQMLRISGAMPLELGAVNYCSDAMLERACGRDDVAGALYVSSSEIFPTGAGAILLPRYAEIVRAAALPLIVDAAAQPLLDPFLASGADAVMFSPHKFMGSPTAGVVAGRAPFIAVCRSLEYTIGRPFKASKEAIAGAMAAIPAWYRRARQTTELWHERARYAQARVAGIRGLRCEPFEYPAPARGFHARIQVDAAVYGHSAADIARYLRDEARPAVAVIDDEARGGAVILNFAWLAESDIDYIAATLAKLGVEHSAALR